MNHFDLFTESEKIIQTLLKDFIDNVSKQSQLEVIIKYGENYVQETLLSFVLTGYWTGTCTC